MSFREGTLPSLLGLVKDLTPDPPVVLPSQFRVIRDVRND